MLISIKANCIDSTAPPEQVFAQEVEKLRQEKFFPKEQLTLEPYERDHAVSYASHRIIIFYFPLSLVPKNLADNND